MKTISADEFKKQYGEVGMSQFGPEQKKPGYLSRVGTAIKDTFTGLKSDLGKQADTLAEQELEKPSLKTAAKSAGALARGGLRTAGAVAQGVTAPITELPGVKQATEFVGEKVAGTSPVKKFNEWAQKHPEAAKDIMNAVDVAGLLGAKVAAKPVASGVKTAAKATGKALDTGVDAGIQAGKQIATKGKTLLEPPALKPKEAVGQVLQGEARDVRSGIKALRNVDTTGVKTYEELAKKVDDSIGGLSKQVDESLDSTAPLKLEELKLTGKTKAGQKVSVDYVSRSLEHLKELYQSTGDDIAAKDIEDILSKAQTKGLTRLEVNNISRRYGAEFGEKAFGKMGDPLTSVNAVKFENTRKALKEIARKGLGGKEAKALDESISSLYRVKDLVKKNAEAVTKLKQKIQERGLLEKLGYYVSKTADTLSGGSLRGIMGGLLPRGAGYKVMNALDLEQSLQRNLEVIQKALKANDPELMRLLKKKPKVDQRL